MLRPPPPLPGAIRGAGGARLVCDLTLVLRARLLCGLYSPRAVPPPYRPLAVLYCFIVATAIVTYSMATADFGSLWKNFYWPVYGLYFTFVLVSFWTGDEYIYRFFTINELTDVTLDSPRVFSRLQKQITRLHTKGILFSIVLFILRLVVYKVYTYKVNELLLIVIAFSIDHLATYACSSSNLLIMSLFSARLLVLKRRLQRYGFRAVGRVRLQPYTYIYHEILRGLDAMNNPLKPLLFCDLIYECFCLIAITVYYFAYFQWQNLEGVNLFGNILAAVMAIVTRLGVAFGYFVVLQTAAAHVDDMALFTATQLIKNPTDTERRRMRDFLSALEQRGASVCVLRALNLDARLMLAMLAFCSTQIVLLITILRNADYLGFG